LQRGRTHWILWLKRYDDNWGRWEEPIAIARCPWKGIGYNRDAAMVLLAAVLAEDRRRYVSDLDRFHSVSDTGLLSIGDLDAVANRVYGRHVSSDVC
jgi:hypothetical protein